jgi:putative oxidoreductase
LIDITVAILTTKVPMLSSQGFWTSAHEARTDWCMFFGSLGLLIVGGGESSLDAKLASYGAERAH